MYTPPPHLASRPARADLIRYTGGPCALGAFLVARSQQGTDALLLGDSRRQLRQALREVAPGQTASYVGVARRIGAPAAARAVAAACAANRIAIVIPCHRVVRADGRATGYRWGARRRAWLLQHEAAG